MAGLKDAVKPGKNPPEEVYAVIEIPQGSRVKYEIDEDTGAIMVDRVLYTSMFYPFNYGFVPQTLYDDGDPVDILVMGYEPLAPGTVIPCKPVAVLVMEDESGLDNKILAVPTAKIDPRFAQVSETSDLPAHTMAEIKHFFERYKELEPGKWVKVREWKSAVDAKADINRAIAAYQAKKAK
jgi:inorganic pyrophosphatase